MIPVKPATIFWRCLGVCMLMACAQMAGCAKRLPRTQETDSGSGSSPVELARLEFAKGQPAKALELLTRLLASQPDLPEALLERARCEIALGKNPAALADLDRLLGGRTQLTEGLYERGMLLAKTGEKERSKSDLRQAMAQDVMLELYLNWRGLDDSLDSRLRAEPGPWLIEFGQLAEAEPNNPTLFLLRGLCHLVDGEKNLKRESFVLAEVDFTRAINLFKANPMLQQSYDTWANRAFVRAFLGKEAEAEEDKREAFSRLPTPEHGREVAERISQAKSRSKELR